jgi:hypothetical protein
MISYWLLSLLVILVDFHCAIIFSELCNVFSTYKLLVIYKKLVNGSVMASFSLYGGISFFQICMVLNLCILVLEMN